MGLQLPMDVSYNVHAESSGWGVSHVLMPYLDQAILDIPAGQTLSYHALCATSVVITGRDR
jgi:hypothetical protein